MADVLSDEIVVDDHKESESSIPDSLDQLSTKESSVDQTSEQGTQDESQGTQKKVWDEETTRALIQLYKANLYKLKNPEYTKKMLYQDIAEGLQSYGYDKEPNSVKNRLKTLRNCYRKVIQYNKRHVEKKTYPYFDELTELYALEPTFGEDPYESSVNSNMNIITANNSKVNNTSYSVASNSTNPKSLRLIRKSRLESAENAPKLKLKNGLVPNGFKMSLKKKPPVKKTSYPLYQCGVCFGKFKSSYELHTHNCSRYKNSTMTTRDLINKKKISQEELSSGPFRWNSMLTLNFLEILKDYKINSANPNSKAKNSWADISALMKKDGTIVSPEELEKKWKILATTYQKTVNYNKRHPDKKKCAFFKRLSELYRLGASVNMFNTVEPVKMTVEVSPYSFISQSSNYHTASSSKAPVRKSERNEAKAENTLPHKNVSELIQWLDNYWKEWKAYEQQREAALAQRHMELMEVLSCVAESLETNRFPNMP